jgi:hypothetical protein
VNVSVLSCLPIINSYGAVREIDAKFGEPPVVDGIIDDSTNEWKKATKIEISLVDLPVKLWVLQTSLELFISVQFDLSQGYHSSEEFIGILISNSSSENQEDFIDAKFVQFSNISAGEFDYLDYFINDSVFLNDTIYNGKGAGRLEGISSVYEFSLPINPLSNHRNLEDASLNYEDQYAFNITYGETPLYPQGAIKGEVILININSPSVSEILFIDATLFILSILVFSITGILLGLYVYKIFKLKEKIEKLRR